MKKKRISFLLAFCLFISCFCNVVYADNADWNSGAKINFVPYVGQNIYKTSEWFETSTQDLGLEAYEDLTQNASRWDVFAGMLRTYQAYLKANGYNPLTANGANLNNFDDIGSLVPNAQDEAKIMVSLGMLSGIPENDKLYMRMSDNVKRGEVAKILATFYQSLNPIQPIRDYNGFIDVEGHWAEEFIKYCYERDLLDGRGAEFAPDDNITKEEAIQILCNMNEKNVTDGINYSHIAKAINETYKVISIYYDTNISTTPSPNSNIPITPNEYSYVVEPNGGRISVTLMYSTNRQIEVTAANDNIKITGKRSNSGNMTVTVEGVYSGDSYLCCRYKNSGYNESLYIPIFVRSRYTSNSSIRVDVRETNISLNPGATYMLSNNITVYNSNNMYGQEHIYYVSTNPSVAFVDYYSGLITAKSKGSCYIYILGYGITKRVKLSVSNSSSYYPDNYYPNGNYYSKLSLTEYYGELYVGRTLNIKNKVYNQTGSSLRYSSSNTKVATVSSSGIVTAKSAGYSIIKIYCSDDRQNYVEYRLQVLSNGYYDEDIPITQISFTNGDQASIAVGEVYYLDDYIEVYPYYADRSDLRYRSEDSSIAKVNSRTGEITGISKGSTTIKVFTDYGSRYFYIYVDDSKIKVSDIQIANPVIEIEVNSTYDLSKDITVLPSNATNKNVFYNSDNMDIAFVSTVTGLVSGVSAGETNITVELDGIKKIVKVIVKESQGEIIPTLPPQNPTDPPASTTAPTIPTDPPQNPDYPPVQPPNTTLSFAINETIQIGVGSDFNPYSVLVGNFDGIAFSFSKQGYAKIENGRIVGVAKSNEPFYLIATNKYGNTAQLPIMIV